MIKHTVENYSIKDVGYVYVVEDKEKGIVKIGRSANPKQRIRNIKRAACAQGREYISHRVLGASGFENKTHKALAKHHISNEWFKVSFQKAVKIVQQLMPKEVTEEQIKALKKKEKESDERACQFVTEAIIPNFLKKDEGLSGKEIKRVNVDDMLSPKRFIGAERLNEIFDQGGEPTSQEWEDGYTDAVGEWMRLSESMVAFLSALEVLNINDFADVWRAYKLNIAKAKLQKFEESQIH